MRLYVARRPKRMALLIQTQGTRENPSLLFFLPKMSQGQLDEYIRKELEKQKITNETEVRAIIDKAEAQYEERIKTAESEREVRRLMGLRAEGKKLLQVGRRRWKEVYYPATKEFKK